MLRLTKRTRKIDNVRQVLEVFPRVQLRKFARSIGATPGSNKKDTIENIVSRLRSRGSITLALDIPGTLDGLAAA